MGTNNSKAEAETESGFYNPAKHQGVAIIFNQETFDSSNLNRQGSRHDEEAMNKILSKFKLGVKLERDNSKNEILSTMRSIAAMDHSNSTCVVVVIMTHGADGGRLYARDGTYNKKEIIDILIGCEELAGKPKIIIIQACRGNEVSQCVKVSKTSLMTDSAMLVEPRYVPAESQLIVCHSTYEGKVAFRDTEKGTIFIQAVCKVLDKHGKKDDIQSIFTRVANKVATDKSEEVLQMPTTETTLTSKFYLGEYLKFKNSIFRRISIKKPDGAVEKGDSSSTAQTSLATPSASRTFRYEPNGTLETVQITSSRRKTTFWYQSTTK